MFPIRNSSLAADGFAKQVLGVCVCVCLHLFQSAAAILGFKGTGFPGETFYCMGGGIAVWALSTYFGPCFAKDE